MMRHIRECDRDDQHGVGRVLEIEYPITLYGEKHDGCAVSDG